MLTKEKNYYIKKCEQHNKQLQNEIEITRMKAEQQTQINIEQQIEALQKQQDCINEFEVKFQEMEDERQYLNERIFDLEN